MKDLYHYGIDQAGLGGSNAIYLHKETGRDYALQVLAEEKRRDKDGVVEWKQIRKDNHLLDAEVLALSIAQPQWTGGGVNLVARPPASRVDRNVPEPSLNMEVERRASFERPSWLNR